MSSNTSMEIIREALCKKGYCLIYYIESVSNPTDSATTRTKGRRYFYLVNTDSGLKLVDFKDNTIEHFDDLELLFETQRYVSEEMFSEKIAKDERIPEMLSNLLNYFHLSMKNLEPKSTAL